MRTFACTLFLATVFVCGAGSALAADPVGPVSPPAPVPSLPAYDDLSLDWTGFYAGVYGIVDTAMQPDTSFGGGVTLGINQAIDFFLIGGEVSVGGLTDGTNSTVYGQVLARGGLIVTDEVAAYGAVGYGLDLLDTTNDYVMAGGGIEMALDEAISLRGQYLHGFALGAPTDTDQFTIGVNYHYD